MGTVVAEAVDFSGLETQDAGNKGPIDPNILTAIPSDGPEHFFDVHIGQINRAGDMMIRTYNRIYNRTQRTGRSLLHFTMN